MHSQEYIEFLESETVYRLLLQHPVPWKYVGGRNGNPASIVDVNEKIITTDQQVSSAIFDVIWTVYWDFLRKK